MPTDQYTLHIYLQFLVTYFNFVLQIPTKQIILSETKTLTLKLAFRAWPCLPSEKWIWVRQHACSPPQRLLPSFSGTPSFDS